jgi:hypothetical protein
MFPVMVSPSNRDIRVAVAIDDAPVVAAADRSMTPR